jgi:hypothetical protein
MDDNGARMGRILAGAITLPTTGAASKAFHCSGDQWSSLRALPEATGSARLLLVPTAMVDAVVDAEGLLLPLALRLLRFGRLLLGPIAAPLTPIVRLPARLSFAATSAWSAAVLGAASSLMLRVESVARGDQFPFFCFFHLRMRWRRLSRLCRKSDCAAIKRDTKNLKMSQPVLTQLYEVLTLKTH